MARRLAKPKTPILWIGLAILFILLISAIFYLSFNYCGTECRFSEFQKGMAAAATPPPQSQSHVIVVRETQESKPAPTPTPTLVTSHQRDMRVLKDPLYPPVNRTETQNFNAIKQQVEDRQFYVPTKGRPADEYRLVGYYTCDAAQQKDAGNNSWKLFARKIDSNRSTFYMSPTDKTLDIKVPITDDITAPGYRLRDLYDIPSTIRFKNPLLNADQDYKFIELPKTDLQTEGAILYM